ncbi:unnamed protein product [Boreogadus saida]
MGLQGAVQSCGSTSGSAQVRGLIEWGRGHGREKPTPPDDNKPPYNETQPPCTSLHTSIVSRCFIRLQAKEFGETCQCKLDFESVQLKKSHPSLQSHSPKTRD